MLHQGHKLRVEGTTLGRIRSHDRQASQCPAQLENRDRAEYAPNRELLAGEIATILVGPFEAPFEIPIALLSSQSTFFRKAFDPDSPFREATSGVLHLPDDSPGAFACLARWLWTRDTGLATEAPWMHLARLWVLADKLLIPSLCDSIMGVFAQKFRLIGGCISPSTINYIFSNTSPSLNGRRHPLRRMIVDLYAWGGSLRDVSHRMGEYDRGFLEALAVVLESLEQRGIWTEGSRDQPFLGEGIGEYYVSSERLDPTDGREVGG
jgi:hypothetical protein